MSPELPPAVEARGLEYAYRSRKGVHPALAGLSFQVAPGEIFGVLGPNGSGKTTLIRMLCGLMVPSAGSATVAGYDVAKEPDMVKSNIGYMSQRFGLYADLTAGENMSFYGGLYGLRERRAERIRWASERMRLAPVLDRLVGPLSGGQKQRVALACATLHHPPVVFLDEPTAGVDPGARRLFWTIIRSLATEGTTIIVTTHYMDEAEQFTRLAFLSLGKLTAIGTPAEVRAAFGAGKTLEDIFVQLQEQSA